MTFRILFSAVLLAVGLGACSSSGGNYSSSDQSTYRNCYDCGVVQGITSYRGERRTTGAGAVTGAIVGGALGNQVGSGDGKTAATVAGVVAGAVVGNQIEKNMNDTWYEIRIRMNDGRVIVLTQDELNGVREGSAVIVRDGRARLN